MSMNIDAEKRVLRRCEHGDTPAEVQRIQHEICRKIPLGRKLELTFSMYDTGRLIALAGLRMLHPEVSEEQLQRLWALKHLGPDLFSQVYGEPEHG